MSGESGPRAPRLPPLLAVGILAATLAAAAHPAAAALSAGQRSVLHRYLDALRDRRYPAAYVLLSGAERRYFGTAANFASIFEAKRLRIGAYAIVGSTRPVAAGTVAFVRERIAFADVGHRTSATATVEARYGLVRDGGRDRIKDPYHPWRAVVPAGSSAASGGVEAIVREYVFYTGRLDVTVTFRNRGDRSVTLLPYGRTVLRDAAGRALTPIAVRSDALTDKTLYQGLVLAPDAQYTGTLAFATPDRFAPGSLALTIAPALFEGGDAPFALAVPPYRLP